MRYSELEAYIWPDWTIESIIGQGAYGTVYKIKREDISGTYYSAMKVLSLPETDQKLVNDVGVELALMEKLKGNSFIVSYEDHRIVQRTDGTGWTVLIRMELLAPLTKYCSSKDFIEEDVIKLGIDICSALEICQQENIIHRNIKTNNIFVSHYGNYKLGDFGLAQNFDVSHIDSVSKDMLTYMAPEVYRGETYDLSIDIYALGLIMYRLLNNGRAPFVSADLIEIRESDLIDANTRRLNGESLPRPANASEGMAQIIAKACAYNSQNRYHSPTDLKLALTKLNDGDSLVQTDNPMNEYFMKAGDLI